MIPPNDDVIVRRAAGAAQFSEHGLAVDYEVEFGVVLGSRAKNVPREEALDHVFGYTVFNDVGARSVQFHNGQRDLGKNFDRGTFMQPPRFLQPGDVVTVSANGIGELTNRSFRVRRAPAESTPPWGSLAVAILPLDVWRYGPAR